MKTILSMSKLLSPRVKEKSRSKRRCSDTRTQRRDATSTLPVKNNTYWYPSLGTSFIITDAFKIQSKILSYAKVRASAAEVGNDTDPY